MSAHARDGGPRDGGPRDGGPWYREPWPWILIAIPASSVAFGILMLTLALGTNNSLVVDDYYREGKAINQRIERDRRAAELGVSALVRTGPAGLELTVSGPGGAAPVAAMLPPEIRLRWAHVTQDVRDGEALLRAAGAGRYVAGGDAGSGAQALPTKGRYRLHVEPFGDGWRLVSPVVVLAPGAELRVGPPEPVSNAPSSAGPIS